MDDIDSFKSVNKWLSRLRPVTRRAYRDRLNGFCSWCDELGNHFAGMTPDELIVYQGEHQGYDIVDAIQEYIIELSEDGWRYNSLKVTRSTLRSFGCTIV